VEGSRVHGGLEERRWEFVLSDRPERAIGTLRLAVIEVEIRLWGYTIEERHAFVAHLERHFQRAGG
jgi:hypothetical protein